MKKLRILFVRTAMGQGGADRVTSIVLQQLDRSKFIPSLLLMCKEGEYLATIPPDITVEGKQRGNLWSFVFEIHRYIKVYRPDVVFSIDGGVNVPLSLLAAFSIRRQWRCVLSERNILFPPGKSFLKRSLLVFLKILFYRFADTLTAVSYGVRKDMSQKLLLSESKIKIVNNPMVEDRIRYLANESINHPWFQDRQVPVIVHAGRFVYQKDHESLIKAFALVRAKIKTRLFLLGEGPLLESCQKLVDRLGIKEDVCFFGFDLNPFRFFSKASVFVLSSRHEGMPGVLIQAMACGAPVIATDCPYGPSEIIDSDGNNGLLVPVGDVRALSEAIKNVITSTQLQTRLRENSAKAVSRFFVEDAMKSYEEAILA